MSKVVYVESFDDIVTTKDLESRGRKRDCYYCPFCIENGEPTSKPTFYIYHNSDSGYCFRCDTAVILKNNNSSSLFDNSLDKIVSDLTLSSPEVFTPKNLIVNLSELQPFTNSPELVSHVVQERSPDYLDIMMKLDVRMIRKSGKLGFLFPFYYNSIPVYYQIRFINVDKKSRFFSMFGKKVPYRIIDSYNCRQITLCEGIFSAIGAYKSGFPSPIALLGKVITEDEIEIFKKYKKLTRVYLYLDDLDLSKAVAKMISKSLSLLEIYIILSEGDPDEVYRKGLKTTIQKYENVEPIKVNLLKGLQWIS